jgi:5-methyltetrahydropteroyltriglutamate--homocysteine methyltransferase
MSLRPRLIGYPRIGPQRGLKWALEGRWAGSIGPADFETRVAAFREQHLTEQRLLVGMAVDDFFLYDQALETAMMLGAVPAWAASDDPFESLTGLARGSRDHEAWEMTKWFDTNYHYVVPEITSPPKALETLPWREPVSDTTWAILGPYSLVKLSKMAVDPAEVAAAAAHAVWDWAAGRAVRLQLDEPCLGLVLSDDDRRLLEAAYRSVPAELSPFVSVQFGRADLLTVALLSERGAVVQVPHTHLDELAGAEAWSTAPERLISVMDGRSIWVDDPRPATKALATLTNATVHVCPTTSLMFLPYTIEGEELPEGFQFAREKAAALREWVTALNEGRLPDLSLPVAPGFPAVGELTRRASREERRAAQADLDLPDFPTTTTGSLPQTAEVRRLRTALRNGELDDQGYLDEVDRLIAEGIAWQERVGLDVLVHGEFERTDMVEYFGERMEGFLTTDSGWVLSYGSRCVRPPIIAAPPSISQPMTVREWQVAQAASAKPVKGMLTGPVTIVNWSFRPPDVPDDRLFWAVAQPIAQEVGYLVKAGARVIQIDEPAVRERWPLPTSDGEQLRGIYARGVRAALNRVFDAPSHVQMHTHMCYGTDASIAPLFSEAGVDVASIYHARSKDDERIRAFYELYTDGHMQIGPGAFDVHSPHSPGADTIEERLAHFLSFMDPVDLWVNPDCGLKTRRWEEIDTQLGDMVAAARRLRDARVEKSEVNPRRSPT